MVREMVDCSIEPKFLRVEVSFGFDALLDFLHLCAFIANHLLVDGASTLVHKSLGDG